jgi:hypothetical protein
MKIKKLTKKIQRLTGRLQKGAKDLARMKRELKASEARKLAKTERKRADHVQASSVAVKSAPEFARHPRLRPITASAKPANGQIPLAAVKKSRQISPERRAQLSAAMKARWAAKRAAT